MIVGPTKYGTKTDKKTVKATKTVDKIETETGT